MKALVTVIVAGVLLGGVFADRAEAGDHGRGKRGRVVYRDGGHYHAGYYRGALLPTARRCRHSRLLPAVLSSGAVRIGTIAAAICRPGGERASSQCRCISSRSSCRFPTAIVAASSTATLWSTTRAASSSTSPRCF